MTIIKYIQKIHNDGQIWLWCDLTIVAHSGIKCSVRDAQDTLTETSLKGI